MIITKRILQKKVSPYNLYYRWFHLIPKPLRPLIQAKIFPQNPSRNFDLYISTGNNCTAAFALKILNLRTFSFPFDWLWGVPLLKNLDWILLEFKNFLEYNDLRYPPRIENGKKHLQVKTPRLAPTSSTTS